jgi:hypothetical protein
MAPTPLDKVVADVQALTPAEQHQVRDWLERHLTAPLSPPRAALPFVPLGFGMWADRPEMQDAVQRVATLRGQDAAPASELATLQTVYDRLGLQYTVEPYVAETSLLDVRAPTASQQAQWCLACGQNYLYFDRQGRFLGTLGDENGVWEPRLPEGRAAQDNSHGA